MNRLGIIKTGKVLAFALALCAALALSAATSAQSNKPISRKGLVESVRANGLSTSELVRIINRRGVAFEMTPDAEAELRGVGARPEIIEAARSNYRAPAVASATRPAANTRPANATPSNSSASVPPGPPLSKSEVITMLQGGIAPARVEQFVEARGVSFGVTPDVAREIMSAGGNRSLVGAITEKATVSSVADSGTSSSPFADAGDDAGGAPDYDDFIDRAQSAISAQDWNSAISYVQQAARLDPQQPTAFTILGTMLLYGRGDVAGAEQAMRAAIERGGAAAFKVYHDHTGSFTQYCEGSFFVTRNGVSFKADDGRDTFETEDSNIKEAKTNAWVGSEYGAFHIKPVQKINGRDNFNFAPNSRNKIESELILRMIKSF